MEEYNAYLNKRLQSTALALPECGPRTWYKGELDVSLANTEGARMADARSLQNRQLVNSSLPLLGLPVRSFSVLHALSVRTLTWFY
jgi:hypothetical protein